MQQINVHETSTITLLLRPGDCLKIAHGLRAAADTLSTPIADELETMSLTFQSLASHTLARWELTPDGLARHIADLEIAALELTDPPTKGAQ